MQWWLLDENSEVPQVRSKPKLYHLNISADSVNSLDHLIMLPLVTFSMMKHHLTET